MVAFQYAPELEVREELTEAYLQAWRIIAAPGNWWTARERVAIAMESRRAPSCALCAVPATETGC